MSERKNIDPERYYQEAKKQFQDEQSKRMGPVRKPGDYFTSLNKKGRSYYLFPLLERNGLDSWEKINTEVYLIDEKKSQFSREVRDAIVHLHTHCIIQCGHQINEEQNG